MVTLTIAVLANLGIAFAAGAISMFQEKEPRQPARWRAHRLQK
jgi:hypothetical protein